jgi:hypothetical protein
MRKRYVLLGIKIAEASLVIAVAWCFVDSRPGITRENLYRLRPGMSWQQAESTLGRPGEYVSTCSSSFATVADLRRASEDREGFTMHWRDEEVDLQAQFDGQGQLIRAHLFSRDANKPHWAASTDDSPIEKSCKSLGFTHKNGSSRL